MNGALLIRSWVWFAFDFSNWNFYGTGYNEIGGLISMNFFDFDK